MTSEENTVNNEWMIRPCKAYLEEYKDCRSIKARLHQYFIYGNSLDCSQWRRDYDSCIKWQDEKNLKAANDVIQSESERRMKRLRGHYGNDVWEKREFPPKEWNKPLPDYLQEQYEHSYLHLKSKELQGEELPIMQREWSICVLM
ncbi:hypothetical protein FQR65_LT06554 [Abscondita terminalis]|nr:hypothetical protein FQR65_LT06554 [Abscondita terminalis]